MMTNIQLEEFRKILDFFNSEEKFDIDAYTKFVVQWESMLKYYPNAEYWGWIY